MKKRDPRGAKFRLSPDQVRLIVEAYQKGCSLRYIRDRLKEQRVPFSHQAIANLLTGASYGEPEERGGAPILTLRRTGGAGPKPLSPTLIDEIRAARKRGMPIKMIIDAYGVCAHRIYTEALNTPQLRNTRRKNLPIAQAIKDIV